MKKFKKGRKFHRERDQRKAFLNILGENLVMKEKIITTKVRAKTLRSFIEKKITVAKNNNLSSQKSLRKYFSEAACRKLIQTIAPLVKNRKGGYTRITKLHTSRDDGAEMAKIEILKDK